MNGKCKKCDRIASQAVKLYTENSHLGSRVMSLEHELKQAKSTPLSALVPTKDNFESLNYKNLSSLELQQRQRIKNLEAQLCLTLSNETDLNKINKALIVYIIVYTAFTFWMFS